MFRAQNQRALIIGQIGDPLSTPATVISYSLNT
jgi:hypothetical protein